MGRSAAVVGHSAELVWWYLARVATARGKAWELGGEGGGIWEPPSRPSLQVSNHFDASMVVVVREWARVPGLEGPGRPVGPGQATPSHSCHSCHSCSALAEGQMNRDGSLV